MSRYIKVRGMFDGVDEEYHLDVATIARIETDGEGLCMIYSFDNGVTVVGNTIEDLEAKIAGGEGVPMAGFIKVWCIDGDSEADRIIALPHVSHLESSHEGDNCVIYAPDGSFTYVAHTVADVSVMINNAQA